MNKIIRGNPNFYKNSNRRDAFDIKIGIDKELVDPVRVELASNYLKMALTGLTGGLTMEHGAEGTWTPGSEENDFSGPVEHCIVIKICMTLMPCDTPTVWPKVRQIIEDTNQKFLLGLEHIHVDHYAVEAWHFKLKPGKTRNWFDRDDPAFPNVAIFKRGN